MMRYFIVIAFCFLLMKVSAQNTRKDDCGTPTPSAPLFLDKERLALLSPQYTSPLLMKVFVHIIADDDGVSNIAAADTAVVRHLVNMKNFFAAHNICFILSGIEQINSTDLNNMNTDTEAAELNPFMVPGCLNIFVHNVLFDGTGNLNGNAYGIPNTFLSIVGTAVASTTNLSTLTHEMGHDFGLYHTFTTFGGTKPENVPRSGSCSNCSDNGDLLCDTEADRDEGVDANCVYSGTQTDACMNLFTPNTYNIMTYGNRACRNFFTVGQGQRAVGTILINTTLTATIAPDDASVISNASYTSGRQFLVARNPITILTSSFVVSNTARMNMAAPKVTIKPGTRFTPTGDGYTKIRVNTLCQ